MAKRPKPIVLTVLDGWGFRAETKGNAIALARKPTYDALLKKFPNTLIHTSGPYVGLPEGQMGNSEVGHLNIGAGRIVHMDITRIDLLIANKQLQNVPLFQQAMERGRQRRLHLMGLLSDGGVHSHINHLFALLEMAKQQKVENVFIHCFMDGRDTPPHSGRDFVQQLQQKIRELGVGQIATLVGRYYAMDRDNRWERIELAYRAVVHGEAETRTDDPLAALQRSYEQDVTDEFVEPIVVTTGSGPTAPPVGPLRDDDAVIFFNFRADRARQMTYALAAPDFDKFDDPKRPKKLFYVAMTQYDKNWPWLKYVIGPEKLEHILAQVFADIQYKNLRCAETEKYAHVTYFFNGGVEKPFPGEDRKLIPSPKVATYDLKPEMSAFEVTDELLARIRNYDLIILNFANPDMVGHTGVVETGIKAVETVDACCARIIPKLLELDGKALVTADHGNCEQMRNPDGSPHTSHTSYLVHFLYVANDAAKFRCQDGILADVAPTLLFLLGLPQPKEMTGHNLLVPV